jgi:hypothetical protein
MNKNKLHTSLTRVVQTMSHLRAQIETKRIKESLKF